MKALLIICALAATAHADDPAVDTTPLARRMFDEGVEAARRFDWTVALDRFGKSYELAPRPLTLYNLAGAQVATNRLVRGVESYRRFLRDTESGSYADFRKEAQAALGSLEGKLAWVKLQISNLDRSDQLILDGDPIVQAVVGESMPIDPGRHTLLVRRREAPEIRSEFAISEGGNKTVVVEIVPEAHPEPVKLTGTVALERPTPPPPPKATEHHWYSSGVFWGLVVAGAAAAGGGTYLYLHSRPYDSSLGSIDVNGRTSP